MPVETNCNMRIGNQNILVNSLDYNYPQITVTTEDATYPQENFLSDERYDYFAFQTHFEITASNQEIYINDGADKTVSITVGDYATGTLLATEIQTRLNASSSNWTVAYTSNRFVISNSGSVTLRYSQTSNAAWDDIGFTSLTDTTGTTFTANEIRNHTSETISIDFGGFVDVGLCAIIGPSNEEFSFSDSATITLKANNIDSVSTAPFSETLTVNDDGAYLITDNIDAQYRYFWIVFSDKRTRGYTPKISHIYLGEYIDIDYNITNNFNFGKTDRTARSESESGVLYHDVKSKYWFYNVNYGLLSKTDLTNLLDLWDTNGLSNPFFIAIDANLNITESQKLTCKFVYFDSQPTFQHLFYDKYQTSFALREAL